MAIKNSYYTATAFAIDIGGKFAGWAKKAELAKVTLQEMTAMTGAYHEVRKTGGNVEIGDIKFTYGLAESNVLLDWIQSVLRREVIENDGSIIVADTNHIARRRMNWTGGHIVDLKLSDLDAKEAKNPFTVDVTVKPRNVQFESDSNKINAPQVGNAKQMLVSNFRFQGLGDGIDKHVMKVTWPTMKAKIARADYGDKLLPDYAYAGFEIGPLTIETTATAYPEFEKLIKKNFFARDVSDTDYVPLQVEMLSTNLQKTLFTFEMDGCHLIEVDQGALEAGDKMSTIKAKYSVESIKLVPGDGLK